MQNNQPALRIFVCMKSRVDGRPSCGAKGTSEILIALRKELEGRGFLPAISMCGPGVAWTDAKRDRSYLASQDLLRKAPRRRANSMKNSSVSRRFPSSVFPWIRFLQS